MRMSGDTSCVKRPGTSTATVDTLTWLQLKVIHHTHKETTFLFFKVTLFGFTDTQITDVLRKGLSKLNEKREFLYCFSGDRTWGGLV
jgi:hypothetical protein